MGMVGTTEFATDRIVARAVAISADFRGILCVSEDCRGNGRGRPRITVEIASVGPRRTLVWRLPHTSVVIVALLEITADGRGNCHGRFRGNFRGNRRGLP